MWSKISSALKPRQGHDNETLEHSVAHTDVLSRVYEQHPNMSVFHERDEEVPFPTPSPPPSPSKQGRKGMLKRISRISRAEDAESLRGPSPLKLPISLPKKVRSHMQLKSISLSRTSVDTSRASTDTYRQASDPTRPSLDSLQPGTPSLDSKFDPKFGSVRSILRDPKTPGTGQNVRFFSRDAYKVISPDTSMNSEPDPVSFADRLQKAKTESAAGKSKPSRPSAMEVFSPPKTDFQLPDASFTTPIPPPDMSNLFDMSQEHNLPTIPLGLKTPLLDSAIELDETAGDGVTSTPFKPKDKANDDQKAPHDRSISFSFGQTVFRAMEKPLPVDPDRSGSSDSASSSSHSSKNRNRALSDTVFQSMIKAAKHPEADINDSSEAVVVYASPEPDPFRANATTYYTPQTMIPPTPPQGTHSRTASREEDIIWSLRTQLALQQELSAQYEIDLAARDELVQALSARLETADKENEKRRSVLRSWKKKAAELEKMCRHLEEEVDNSRQESMERSIMDEASGEALRQLHRQISQLEREKSEVEAKEAALRSERDALETSAKEKDSELAKLRDALKARDDSERALREGIKDAKEQMEQISTSAVSDEDLKAVIAEKEQVGQEERARHSMIEFAWAEEQQRMIAVATELQQEKESLVAELATVRDQLVRKDDEYAVLKSELEAQWQNTEKNGEKMEEIVQERDSLKADIVALENKISSMEEDFNESENRKNELDAELQDTLDARDALEKERDELEEQLHQEREHADGLTRALQEQEDRLSHLDGELEFMKENVARLEQNVKERDAEIASLSEKVVERTSEAEALREQLSSLRRESTRSGDVQKRELDEAVASQREAREQLEAALQEKAISDINLGSTKERLHSLTEEMSRLRTHVHQLQKESADKEVTIVQLNKQVAQDKEDINGLNIALDSKQQELELVKRKHGVRGTGGATPAPSKVAPRRESSAFSTPSAVRPPSALSDISRDGSERKLAETPSGAPRASIGALSRSVRMNAASTAGKTVGKPAGSMGPPAAKVSRPSMSGTSTPTAPRAPSSLGRSGSARPSVTGTPTVVGLRRASSSSVESQAKFTPRRISVSSAPSELDEKENVSTPASLKTPRRAMVPT
ncbi:hypothetical protein HYDPIDRAFT_97711 [Hydnomerulius pinastri MD-312]|uniref:Uncharacterized protein n=1 Tax=Hydnomerulius pinastri MD-312 TaxID=994086 RepID=A0A0C9VSR3_9AGAM|nr:hypothetical protein HYDPIDRAFT_97711 [Hydnomerulius pinastri MD-312]